MADWYCSSAAYTAIAAFVPSVAYSVGQIVKPTAPVLKAQWVFRCTTAGTASTEPNWTSSAAGNNNTVVTGGATFTNVTGQSTYGWTAAAGDLVTLVGTNNRFAGGDRIFISSDHTETQTTSPTIVGSTGASSLLLGQVLSVNRAGSVPPVAADLTAGATIACTSGNNFYIDSFFPVYHYGITYNGVNSVNINTGNNKMHYFDNCQISLASAASGARFTTGNNANCIMNNTTLRCGNVGNAISSGSGGQFDILWLNTPNAIAGATIPTTLFAPGTTTPLVVTARGVDFSAITGTLVAGNNSIGSKFLFDSCRIASGVTRYTPASGNLRDIIEFVNCYDGTNFISESYQIGGAVTTEFTITLNSGATDNVGTFSHKMVSNANVDKYVNQLNGFWLDVNYATTGSAKTATVEIISSASLNNDEISLLLEYEGTASSSVASMATSLPATVLTAASAVSASTATWNSSPATPVRQHLQVTFTPRTAGRVRAQVRLGKPSTTVYVDPRVTIS